MGASATTSVNVIQKHLDDEKTSHHPNSQYMAELNEMVLNEAVQELILGEDNGR